MTETENLVLEQLRAIRNKLDRHSEEFHSLGQRMTAIPSMWEDLAGLKRRIERIEARLELAD